MITLLDGWMSVLLSSSSEYLSAHENAYSLKILQQYLKLL